MKDNQNDESCAVKRLMKAPGACCSVLILLLLALLVTCAPAWAAEYIVVKKDAMANNDEITYTKDGGASQDTSLKDLVNNLDVSSGDTFTVNVGPGEYILSDTLTLKKGVKLIGAGAENTTLKVNKAKDLTIIMCKDSGATSGDTLFSGFTVTGGNAGVGGGMRISGASPTVTNCTFSGNQANSGGGMYIYYDASPTVTNCTFAGNSADDGGGMSITGGSPTVTNCTFAGNTAKLNGNGGGGSGSGGGMDIWKASPAVTNCTFAGNQANSGGGMSITNASPTVTNCTFAGNTAKRNGNGGGINVNGFSARPVVVNTILWGNTASGSGKGPAVYSEYGATVSLKNCVVNGVDTYRSGLVKRENCVTASPLLVACDAAGNEGNGIASTDIRFYRPGRNGSAIGRGLPVGTVVSGDVKVPATDQLGRDRPGADGKVDIGAVQHEDAPSADEPMPAEPPIPPAEQGSAGVTLTPTPGVELSGDQMLINIPSGGSAVVTLRVTNWKDRNGSAVTPYEVRVYVDGRRRESRQDAETCVLTLTPADAGRLVEVLGHIAGDRWIKQTFTVTQSDTISPGSPSPTPTDPAGPSDPTPTPTPDPTPADPTTPDSGESSGGSGGGCQAMGLGLFGLAALALLKKK